jgi:hypothetical protein
MPLQPTEIRINNVIQYNDDLLTVHSYDFANLDWSKAEGIELLIETVEDAGFRHEIHDDSSYYIKGKIWIAHNYDNEWFLSGIYQDICKPFKYVHQLQNLIHALTGEEINIQL